MKIKEFKCRNCQHDDFQFTPNARNRNVVGIYCSRCGEWFKWADKNEKNLMRMSALELSSLDQKTTGTQNDIVYSEKPISHNNDTQDPFTLPFR